MAINAISLNEAISQGSTWSQMLSISAFHERASKLVTISQETLSRMPAHKAKARQRASEAEVRQHREYSDYFRKLAASMKDRENDK